MLTRRQSRGIPKQRSRLYEPMPARSLYVRFFNLSCWAIEPKVRPALAAQEKKTSPEAILANATDRALEFVDRCGEHTDVQSLLSDFSSVIKAMGFSTFMMTGLPSMGEDVETLIVANHWPAEWTHRYREAKYSTTIQSPSGHSRDLRHLRGAKPNWKRLRPRGMP